MIPRIAGLKGPDPAYSSYLQALRGAGFKGDLDPSHSSRLLTATDNSVYQRMPEAVIFPKDEEDISLALKIRLRPGFEKIVITPRGGGTGTNGQSLNRGITLDCSRHMKTVFAIEPEKRVLRAQCGCIKDELNEALRPYGLFFSPELSTSSRATLGGMIANDAAGQGSLKYGRTSSHVLSLRAVLWDGTAASFGPVSGAELERLLRAPGTLGGIYRAACALLKDRSGLVRKIFPRLNRFMTGYDLYHAWDPASGTLNLARLICGAEGTLAVVTEAVLDLTPVPAFRELMVVKYSDFDAALRHAARLVDAGVFSVETVDSKVLGLARGDVVWDGVKDYIQPVPGAEISGINIVEFSGMDAGRERGLLGRLYTETLGCAQIRSHGILGAQLVSGPAAIAAVYGMRKKAVGLLGNAAGRRKLVPFTEDTVVPPENLADYILEFRALLDSMDVPYGMFGHVDTGLMHVRPALDLTLDEDRAKLVKISNGVAALVAKYRGQMWGEHGRGYRSVYGESFFKELYPAAREIKRIFDPRNILNPGKICVPLGNETDRLAAVDDPMRGDLDRLVPLAVRNSFKGAFGCNGNGQCFGYSTRDLMCPSYRYTGDHVRSPKGYSELSREWLRLVHERGCDPAAEEQRALAAPPSPLRFIRRAANTLSRGDDYSAEILEKLRTCLSCKACKSVCPAHVNAAEQNSRFLALYYGRYLRPAADLLLLNSERLLPLAAGFPALSNALSRSAPARLILEKALGLVDLPEFAGTPLRRLCREQGFRLLSAAAALREEPEVALVADAFTAAYEPDGLVAAARVVRALGYKVALLRPYAGGKLRVIRGDRRGFRRAALSQAARLRRLSRAGIALVGYDPALTLCYRDEYPELLGAEGGDLKVQLPEEWLAAQLAGPRLQEALKSLRPALHALKERGTGLFGTYYLFTHCTERALAGTAAADWQLGLRAFGLDLIPVPVACCGMAGLHGHLRGNQDESRRVYEQNWRGEIAARPFERCLVTGFSCRSQVRRMEGKRPSHPLEVLDRLLRLAHESA